jgi:hypothetical protein
MSQKGKPNRSPHLLLAVFFVTHVIGRKWTNTDFRGQHIKRASELLKRYAFNDIVGALLALRDGVIEFSKTPPLMDLSIIEKLEPPLLERWLEYKNTEPPSWLEADHQRWEELVHADYLGKWVATGVPLPEGLVRAGKESDPAGRTGRGEPVDVERLPELHAGVGVPSMEEGGGDLSESPGSG